VRRAYPRTRSYVALVSLAIGLSACAEDPVAAARREVADYRFSAARELLAGVDSASARELRDEIERALAHRTALRAKLDGYLDGREDWSLARMQSELREWRRAEPDADCRSWIDDLRSDMGDWVAERDQTGMHAKAKKKALTPAEEDPAQQAGPGPGVDPLVQLVIDDTYEMVGLGEFAAALNMLDYALEDLPQHAPEFSVLRLRVTDEATRELARFADELSRLDDADLDATVLRKLARRRDRFPATDEFKLLDELLAGLRAAFAGEKGEPERAEAALNRDALAQLARESERQGDYPTARSHWFEAARVGAADTLTAEHDRRRALECGWRATLRAELAGARECLRAQGVVELADDGLRLASGVLIAWDAEPERLLALAACVDGDDRAPLGLALELFAAPQGLGRTAGLSLLRERPDVESLSDEHYAQFVARGLAEEPVRGGYEIRDGHWVRRVDLARAASEQTIDPIVRSFKRASFEERRTIEQTLRSAEGLYAADQRAELLEERWAAATALLRQLRPRLEAVAHARADLDHRRAVAIELIFDTRQYFYPYTTPAVSAEKAHSYRAVQSTVDDLVGAVRELWDSELSVDLTPEQVTLLQELEWLRGLPRDDYFRPLWPADFPTWLGALDPRHASVNLRNFAWNLNERQRHRRAAAIRTRNEALWAAATDATDPGTPDAEECEQVRATNEYRAMFGVMPYAWNRQLQLAAQGHSDYMARTGHFGHFEDSIERRTHVDRFKQAGYPQGGSENCHFGRVGARAAHAAWVSSSGHHRNILNGLYREMASAYSDIYWTQNFGTDSSFEDEL